MTKTTDKTIADFVAAVRAELGNLDPAVVAELTDDLEPGLIERRAEEGDAFKLGSAKAFAQELTNGAGLGPKPKRPSGFGQKVRQAAGSFLRWAITLSPAWWVIRALMAYSFTYFILLKRVSPLPMNAAEWLFLLALVVASIQLGKARPKSWWLRAPIAALNILAVLVALEWAMYLNQQRVDYEHLQSLENSNMLVYGGDVAFGIHAFDANGTQLQMATLKDSQGRIIYQAPDGQPQVDVVQGVQGTTLKNALNVLRVLKKDNVSIVYAADTTVAPGTVIGVQQLSDNAGNDYIELTVSK